MKSHCVKIDKRDGEKAIKLLKKHGLVSPDLKIRRENHYLLIPVSDPGAASRLLFGNDIENEECEAGFDEKTKQIDMIARKIREEGGMWRSSYHQVGDIIVFSARTLEEAKQLEKAARKILEHIPYFKSAYAKIKTIGEHRVPELVHLAGEKRTTTIVKEYGIRFFVDIKKAYYNPRFSEEHHRIASMAGDGEAILDMFTGVGGFCLHIAVNREVSIYCNDINPHAITLLHKSVFLNKKKIRGNIYVTNTDAMNLKEILYETRFDRIIMNNPTQSPSFLPVATSLAKKDSYIYLYLLSDKAEIMEKSEKIRDKYSLELVEIKEIIEYSPAASIYRITFIKTNKQ